MDLEEAQESSRGVRKAPASDAMDEGPNAKRQMASLPFDSTMVPMDVSPNQSVPIPSADDVLVDVSSYCVGSWRREKRNIRRIDDRHDHRFSHCMPHFPDDPSKWGKDAGRSRGILSCHGNTCKCKLRNRWSNFLFAETYPSV